MDDHYYQNLLYTVQPVILIIHPKDIKKGQLLLKSANDLRVLGEVTDFNHDLKRIYYRNPVTITNNWITYGDKIRIYVIGVGKVEGQEIVTYRRPTNEEILEEMNKKRGDK